MERERPEYLNSLPRDRSGFPWLTVIGIAFAILMALGVKLYLETHAAWSDRFNRPRASSSERPPAVYDQGSHEWQTMTLAQRAQRITEDRYLIQQMRQRSAEQANSSAKDRKTWKCINGTPFRPIRGGGWENVPGEHC